MVHFKFSNVEIERLKKGGDVKGKEDGDPYLDLFSHKNMKLKERVLIPVKLYPKVSVAFCVTLASFFSGSRILDVYHLYRQQSGTMCMGVLVKMQVPTI